MPEGELEATYNIKVSLRERATRAIRNAEPLSGVDLAAKIKGAIVEATDYNEDEIRVTVERTDQ